MILSISTSTEEGSVALTDGPRVLAEVTFPQGKGHAEQLLASIDVALARAGVDRSAVRRVGVDVGPGSFTGIRVGVATALGVAHGLGIGCDGVTSLGAMASAAMSRGHACVAPVIDAKKAEVFAAIHATSGAIVEARAFGVSDKDELERLAAARGAIYVGAAAATVLGLSPSRDAAFDHPRASAIGAILDDAARAMLVVPPVPVYVRAADAVVTVRAPSTST